MKRTLRLTLFTTAVAAALLSCEKPDNNDGSINPPDTEQPDTPGNPDETPPDGPDQEKPGELSENAYMLNGEETAFGSVAVSNFGEYLYIAASIEEGAESLDEILKTDRYFYVAISPTLNGAEFDLMKETALYTVISTLPGAKLETVAPEWRNEITAGKCRFAYSDGVTSVEIDLVLTGGAEFSAKMTAEEVITINENRIAVDNTVKPLRTAFYQQQKGFTTLYFTPAGLSYSSELEIATYYAYITFKDSQCNGKTMMLAEIQEAGLVTNIEPDNTIITTVYSSREKESTGTVNIMKDPEDPSHYMVVAHIDFDGKILDIGYDGNAIDFNLEPEVTYEVVYNKTSYKINQVTLDKTVGNDLWRVLVTGEGEDFSITMPSSAFDGNPKGFSQFQNNPDVKVTYGENVYNKSTGASGTITVGIEGETIHVEFTNYDNLEVFYEGNFKTIE